MVPGLMIGMFISMLVARLFGNLNFYDAILVQDGHELIKIRPPLDLHSWQNLPISTIANLRPVLATSLLEQDLRALLDKHPYRVFPVVLDGMLHGILTREAIADALRYQNQPIIEKAVTCTINQTVHAVADAFIDSPSGVIVLIEPGTQSIAAIITLHDLLRAQAAILD
jgi:CIC family chloride channel protein